MAKIKNVQVDLEVKEGILKVSRTRIKSGEVLEEIETEDRMDIRPFVTQTANISVKGGATVNLGNYESGRIEVMLSMPCYVEEIEEVYTQVKDFVDAKMTTEYAELVSGKSK